MRQITSRAVAVIAIILTLVAAVIAWDRYQTMHYAKIAQEVRDRHAQRKAQRKATPPATVPSASKQQ